MTKKQTYIAPRHFETEDVISFRGDPERVADQMATIHVIDLGPLYLIQIYVTFMMWIDIPAGNNINEKLFTISPDYLPIYNIPVLSCGLSSSLESVVHSELYAESGDLVIVSTATGISAERAASGGAVYLSKKRGIIV